MHTWRPEPEFSGRSVSRYSCACGAWGYRAWPSRRGAHVPPVTPYAKGFDVEGYRARVAREDLDRQRQWDLERQERRERGLEP